ncbi:MAG: metallophosphoesterase [Candidatus Sumerlaeia bacterium]|nr:metallophosphoesterase [Candidatus Sumerlaeia bacterium]
MSASPFRALHIGDLHFWAVPGDPRSYLGKRALGVANLLLKRRLKFPTAEAAPRVLARAAELRPGAALFSGDFSTTALPAEFAAAASAILAEPALAGRVRAVPGNHDRYTGGARRGLLFERHLAEPLGAPAGFPRAEELAPGLGLLQLDGGCANGLRSFGRVAPEDAARARAALEPLRAGLRALLVLCHFPGEDPPPPLQPSRRGELRGAAPLLDSLNQLGVPVLFLHGHHHYRWAFRSAARPNIAYLNAGSPTMIQRGASAPDLGFFELGWDGAALAVALHRLAEGAWRVEPVGLPAPGAAVDLQRG